MKLSIGSGDCKSIMMGKKTKGYQDFVRKFVSDDIQIYNSYSSPIDALRTGKILEDRFALRLEEGWFVDVKVRSDKFDVMTSSLDFGKMDKGKLVDFIEMKTMWLTDYLDFISPIKGDNDKLVAWFKKSAKTYYEQVQWQLFVSGLDSCQVCYLAVQSYDDEFNYRYDITENDYTMFRVDRDQDVIDKILKEVEFFQTIKNYFK
jgi:hypothetical protein